MGNYQRTYLERDIADLAVLRDLEPFVLAQKAVAIRTGQCVNYADLARAASISAATQEQPWVARLHAEDDGAGGALGVALNFYQVTVSRVLQISFAQDPIFARWSLPIEIRCSCTCFFMPVMGTNWTNPAESW